MAKQHSKVMETMAALAAKVAENLNSRAGNAAAAPEETAASCSCEGKGHVFFIHVTATDVGYYRMDRTYGEIEEAVIAGDFCVASIQRGKAPGSGGSYSVAYSPVTILGDNGDGYYLQTENEGAVITFFAYEKDQQPKTE